MDFTFAIAFEAANAPSGTELWHAINHGPTILCPTRVNSHEPLKKVDEVDINQTCSGYFIWKNGRRCLGVYDPREAYGKVLLSILISYPPAEDEILPEQVYRFIRSNFAYRLMYGASPSKELMLQNLRLHQLVNCGSIPPDERVIVENSHLLRFFDLVS